MAAAVVDAAGVWVGVLKGVAGVTVPEGDGESMSPGPVVMGSFQSSFVLIK